MAETTYSIQAGSASGFNKVWRKVQGKLAQSLNYECEEYEASEDLPKFEIDVSAREITVPLDINEGYGIASISEGDWEAVPSSPNLEEITLNYIELSGRFSASVQTKILDQNHRTAAVVKQILHQGRHKMRDFARDWSDRFYGVSTGYVCQTSTNATSATQTLTLANLYGVSGLGSSAQLCDKFRVGDRIGIIRSGALVANGIGEITAITVATPSITVTMIGSCDVDANDYIVKANSMGNTTIAHTDYNKGLVGLEEMMTATSVHSLSSSSVANWSIAGSSTTAGRFSGVKLQTAKKAIANYGGGKANMVVLAEGVRRDMIALQSAALRFNDPFALELDGQIKSKGLTFLDTRRVPGGRVYIYDKSAVRKLNVMPKLDGSGFSWEDGIRMENKSGYVFPINVLTQLVTTNRKNLYYYGGQTEQ